MQGGELTPEIKKLKMLFITRNIAAAVLLLAFAWFEGYSGQHRFTLVQSYAFLWLALATIQFISFRFQLTLKLHLLLQLSSDLFLIGLVINSSGGISSPFVFLIGLVIITAGSQARILFTLVITILAAVTYLISIHSLSGSLETEGTLKILLQTSLFFLTGGIMAWIARRHALLEDKEQQTSQDHHKLQEVHGQVLEVMHEGVILLAPNFHIQAFNSAAANLLGLSKQHTGFDINSFISIPDQLTTFSFDGEMDMFQHETQKHNHDLLLTFKKLSGGHDVAWLMTLVDITETRKLERKVAEQDKLASIGQMAAMLAHEIRNPMQTISQAVELMGLKHEDKKLEHIVTDEISRLNRLVSDMLDYANPLHPKPQDIKIKDVVTSSVQQVDMNQQYNIQIQVDDAIIVNLDPDHMRLITDNLLRNALRVSPEPNSIVIAFELFDKYWQLRVRDHGTGIDKDMKKSLFLPFQTGHKKGTGLGLATVWQVCQTNAWEIHIDEGITDGACFVVEGKLSSSSSVIGEKHG